MSTRSNLGTSGAPIVIVGAGIAGLSAAWELRQRGHERVIVLEAGAQAGGVLQSERDGDFLLEYGPDSFLARKTAAAELCRELGLANELIACNGTGRTRLLHRGRLCPLPDDWQMLAPGRLWPALTTPLLSTGAKLRIAWRALRAPAPAVGEESVAQFLERHFSRELTEAIAEPLLAGVYGGDPEQLSLRALMPHLAEMDRAHRPLLPQLRRQSRARAAMPQPLFTSLQRGMGSLVEALTAQLRSGWLRLDCAVRAITPGTAGGAAWNVTLASGETVDAAALILAVPAWVSAELLRGVDAAVSAALAAIPYRSAVTVNLGYDRPLPLPPGFGFLVPRREGLQMMACTFAHRKFRGRAAESGALLRLFFRSERAMGRSDLELASIARGEMLTVLGVGDTPALVRIARWPRAMAQYTVGHAGRLGTVEAGLRRMAGLSLAGSALRGIGVPDCIASGRAAALEALRFSTTAPAGRQNFRPAGVTNPPVSS